MRVKKGTLGRGSRAVTAVAPVAHVPTSVTGAGVEGGDEDPSKWDVEGGCVAELRPVVV